MDRLREIVRATTLRRQLILALLALMSAGFVLVAGVTALALHRSLLNRLDQQLLAAGARYPAGLGQTDDASTTGQAAGTLGARTRNGTVTAVAILDNHEQIGTRARATLGRLTPSSRPHSVDLPELGTYRVIVSPAADGTLLITGLPTDPVEDTIHRLLAIEAVVFAVVLVAVAVGGAFVVRLALRPLNQVADMALRVSNLSLASGAVSLPERVSEAPPGTEVGKVSVAFNHMLEHVEGALHERQASEERLRRFLADASHELRTPVAVVRSHAEYAQRVQADLPAPIGQSLSRIAAESERMGHLVEDLLLLARLDSGRPLATDAVDLTRVVLDAVSDARVAGPEHRWQLDLPAEPVTVVGDRDALHQIVANLLVNARVHTPSGTTVRAELAESTDATSDWQVHLIVSDNGPGIPTSLLPTVFERFAHGADARSGTTGSSGLGLAIVAAIVHAHGGTIDLRSGPDGTRCQVCLPRPVDG